MGIFIISTDTHNEQFLKIPIDELTNPTGVLHVYNFVEWKGTLFNELYNWMHTTASSIVVECWHRVREVPGSIPSQGPHHTKDVIKMVPVVPLFSNQH